MTQTRVEEGGKRGEKRRGGEEGRRGGEEGEDRREARVKKRLMSCVFACS